MNRRVRSLPGEDREWLEADGLGGFASGTAAGVRTRRYHALLLVATAPPAGRVVLVNGFEAWVEARGRRVALSSQRYAGDVIHPDGAERIDAFTPDPWPTWRYRIGDDLVIRQEVLVPRDTPAVHLRWTPEGDADGVSLAIRPLLSGRDLHALHHENAEFRFDATMRPNGVEWHPYAPLPVIYACTRGQYEHDPLWYRNFVYTEERNRGLDFVEDLASPGSFRWDLSREEAELALSAGNGDHPSGSTLDVAARDEAPAVWISARSRRGTFPTRLHRAADAYLVRRGSGTTVIAGYPWFGDWGRDTFVALRGLCLGTGRLDEGRDILLAWSEAVSEGMLPNRFVEQGDQPEYNSVDAALWYVVAVDEWIRSMRTAGRRVLTRHRRPMQEAMASILAGYARGTRHGIRADEDGLLAAGRRGLQLTWMDAKVGDWVVTPRIGKPVEVQALWINALGVGAQLDPAWETLHARARSAFVERFWNPERGFLFDVVDVDHRPGELDPTLRPNQIFAVGGLPHTVLDQDRARRIVDVVERSLLTPLGLRSLGPEEPGYRPRYEGGVRERDGAYHQGTAWPWLVGPFVEAWVRVRGSTAAVRAEARERFLPPILAHLNEAGLGHVSEIADAEPPHTPRGCPFQAWSVGEALYLAERVLADP